jgi:hypothetical protein
MKLSLLLVVLLVIAMDTMASSVKFSCVSSCISDSLYVTLDDSTTVCPKQIVSFHPGLPCTYTYSSVSYAAIPSTEACNMSTTVSASKYFTGSQNYCYYEPVTVQAIAFGYGQL